ncbi:MAG: aldo/keto reductase [Clostridia bacterium]
MEYRELPKLNIKTSILGFGGMRFPKLEDGEIDEATAIKMVRYAKDNGVNYFDTAYIYHSGKSEGLYKKALAPYPRDSYFLADKLAVWLINSKDDAEKMFNEQLERCGVDYFDFYLLHSLDSDYWKNHVLKYDLVNFCLRKKAEGKIKNLGFSFHDSRRLFGTILRYAKWDFCQIQYNYMDTKIQAGESGYKYAKKMGIPMVIMEPVKGGLLAKLPNDVVLPFKQLDKDASFASYALRYVAAHDNVKVILSGMSTMEQVEDNVKTFSTFKPLLAKEKNAIKQVKENLTKRVRVGCTGCEYCMPCPSNVSIPDNFSVWNEYGMYENKKRAIQQWNNNISDKEKAKNCINCGRCETLCPQHIKIPDMLKLLQKEMDELNLHNNND